MNDRELLQRAWDALAIWKETYPEGWDADDERLMDDLLTRIAEQQMLTTEYERGYADAMGWKTQNHLEHLPPTEGKNNA